jgi:hypothetical protein
MNAKTLKILWPVFLLFSLLTWLVYFGVWMAASYYVALSVLGLVSACLAFWILREHRFALRPAVLVILALVAGQWWLIEFLAVQILWSIKGFAP